MHRPLCLLTLSVSHPRSTYCARHSIEQGLRPREGRGAGEEFPSAFPPPHRAPPTSPHKHTWKPAVVGPLGPGLSRGDVSISPVLDKPAASGSLHRLGGSGFRVKGLGSVYPYPPRGFQSPPPIFPWPGKGIQELAPPLPQTCGTNGNSLEREGELPKV